MSADPAPEPAAERIYCPRCDKPMPVQRPHRGFAVAYRVWIGVMAVCALCAPIFIADMITMLPLMCGAALGGGTLSRLAKEPTRCRWCSLALESAPRGLFGRREPLVAEYTRARETPSAPPVA